jgi:predicted nucleotidyltransferase
MEALKRRKKLREKIIAEVGEWAQKLSFKATVVLIGSYARGDFNLWSDVDILLITEFSSKNPLERLKHIDTLPGYEIIPLTPNEFDRLLQKGDPMAVEAASEGVIIKDDFNLFHSI